MADTDNKAVELISRTERMKSARSSFENHWEDLRLHYHPQGAPITGTQTPGSKVHANVLDPTTDAIRLRAVAMPVGSSTLACTLLPGVCVPVIGAPCG